MIDLERIADWMTELRPVRTESSLCLRARSGRSACQACVSVCPAGAIKLSGKPVVDPDACTACGLCAAACRTGALRMESPSEMALLAAARKVRGGPAVLACSRVAAELPAAVKSRLVVVPCIGCAAAELLAGMLAAGQERLVLWQPAECEACPNGAGSKQLVSAALAAMAELYPGCVAAGGAPELLTAGASADAAAPEGSADSLDKRMAAQDRRAFLTGAAKNVPGVVAMLFGDWLAGPKAEPPKPAAVDVQEAPRRRQMLLDAMAVKPPAGGARLPERVRSVTSECTLCPACSRLCSSGALRLQTEGDSARLLWQASLCMDCGLCNEVCPLGAIEHGEPMTVAQFRSAEPAELIHAEQAICQCGSPYWRTPGGPSLCVACRFRSRGR